MFGIFKLSLLSQEEEWEGKRGVMIHWTQKKPGMLVCRIVCVLSINIENLGNEVILGQCFV